MRRSSRESGSETVVDDVGGDRLVCTGGGDEVVGFGTLDLVKFDRLPDLELDGLDSMFVIGVAGDEDGNIVAIFEGEREHVGGEHDIDAFFDLAPIGESPQPAPLERKVGDET